MTRNSESSYEEETLSDSSRERNVQPRRPYKGGKIIREEPSIMTVIGKSSAHVELLVPLRLVAILETNKLKLLSFSFMISK